MNNSDIYYQMNLLVREFCNQTEALHEKGIDITDRLELLKAMALVLNDKAKEHKRIPVFAAVMDKMSQQLK